MFSSSSAFLLVYDSRFEFAFLQETDDESQPNHPLSIRPSYSVSSFSVSRITGESSGSDSKDDELSPTYPKQENTKSSATLRYKEKRVAR